jgi:hypothetical protein
MSLLLVVLLFGIGVVFVAEKCQKSSRHMNSISSIACWSIVVFD